CFPAAPLRPSSAAKQPLQLRQASSARNSSRRSEMEVEMQLDDDLFFAELSKRISLLITDDDEADFAASQFPAAVHLPPVSPPPFHPFHTSCFASCLAISTAAGHACRVWRATELDRSIDRFS
uniref:Uncharacterized protein n=1 Tax=Aegilops tauschii subsp. strangulata TaxID=200361 RepID=A0A452Z1T8_AEGTS